MKYLKIFLISLLVGVVAMTLWVKLAVAGEQVCFCHNVNHNPHTICTSNQGQINGHTTHVNNGTDTFGACVAPTATPIPPTPTPKKECEEDCVTPTPTIEPTPASIQQVSPPAEPGLSQAVAPSCSALPVIKAPLYWWSLFSRNGSDMTLKWIPQDSNARGYGIYYGQSQNNLPWYTEVSGQATDTDTIHLIPQGVMWVKICAINNCGQQVCGEVTDP